MSTQKPTDRLKDIRFVTAHYEMLQGYAVAPTMLATAFLFTTLSDSVSWFASGWWTVAALVMLGLALFLAVPIGRWYKRTYGDLVPHRPPGRWSTAASIGLLVALFIVRLIVRTTSSEPFVSPEMITVSVAAIGAAVFLKPLRPAFLTVGLVALVVGVLPLGTWLATGTHPLSELELLLAAISLGMAVIATWSHIVLKRTLGRTRAAA